MKNVLVGLLLLLSVGCGQWTDSIKVVEPVAEHALPFAGETLIRLSDAFYGLCGRDEAARSEACLKVKVELNRAIQAYETANTFILEAY